MKQVWLFPGQCSLVMATQSINKLLIHERQVGRFTCRVSAMIINVAKGLFSFVAMHLAIGQLYIQCLSVCVNSTTVVMLLL